MTQTFDLMIDLQWFAAEDEGRTEEPSEYKIQRAREEGRVAKSQELVGALVLFVPAVMLLFLAPSMLRTCVEMVRFFLLRAAELDPIHDKLILNVFYRYLLRLAVPIVAVAMVSAIFANLVQTGFIFTTKPLTPDFSRVIPRFGRYFQRTLFSVEGLFNFFKSIVKMGIIGAVAFFLISSRFSELTNLQTASLWQGVRIVASMTVQMMIIVSLLLLLLSIPDYMFQRWQYRESLKMSKQELKEEHKMYEGDPMIRSRIRSRWRELLSQNLAANVPRADVVITNPTHYAIALEYDQSRMMPAPQVIAKGEDELALRIRRLAEDNGVPVVENKPLARALYAQTEVGDYVPPPFLEAVALVLAKVWDINEKRRKARLEQEARDQRQQAAGF
ncbi:flagellar biosynthesis protein FlhB [Spirochaetia bacterium]|nr:flagellar biosynthesis protein FlhB [Spirochaetia bacterium]